MDKTTLTYDHHIYDCIGIGFGPSNISLAISLEEKGLLKNSIFLEARDETAWHPGMLIQGTDIQHNPLRDFVTPRNPCSPYGFLSYLKAKGRLFDYLNLAAPFPPRSEYAGYVNWVAQQFIEYVKLDVNVVNISRMESEAHNEVLIVHAANGQSFYTRSLILGCGRSRYIPHKFESLLSENIIHSDDYLWAKKRWLAKPSTPRIAVVGGSQSALEILLDLSSHCPVIGITRSFGFKQKDLSPFTECIYYPEFVDYFHETDVYSQNQITKELWRSNYSAADHDVINALNFRLYEQKVRGDNNICLHQNIVIEDINFLAEEKIYQLRLRDKYTKKSEIILVDGVIFATGYKNFGELENQETHHPLLETLVHDLTFREDCGVDVLRDYRLKTKTMTTPIYLNGLCESSHGFGDAGSFSLLSVRAEVIAESIGRHLEQFSCNKIFSS